MEINDCLPASLPFSAISKRRSDLWCLARAFEVAACKIPALLGDMMAYSFHSPSQQETLRSCLHSAVGIAPMFFGEHEGVMLPLSDEIAADVGERPTDNLVCQALHSPQTSCLEILGLTMVWIKICERLSTISEIVLVRNTSIAWHRCARIASAFLAQESPFAMNAHAQQAVTEAQRKFEALFGNESPED